MSMPEPFDIVDFANDMLSHMAMVRDEIEDPRGDDDDDDDEDHDQDKPDQWDNDWGSPMYGVPPDGDPLWDNPDDPFWEHKE